MVRVRCLSYFIGKLRARFVAESQSAQERRINRTNAVKLGMLFQHLLKDLGRFNRLAVIIKGPRAKSSNQWMIGFTRRALIKFGDRVIVSRLVSKDARSIVAGDNSFSRIEPHHPLKSAQGTIIVAIQSC